MTELRARLGRIDAAPLAPWLSAPGARAAWQAALAPLAALDGVLPKPIGHVVVVGAATVFTAPLEVVVAACAFGGTATWKHPTGQPGVAHAVADADVTGRIRATDDRSALARADTLVVLGSDATVSAVRAEAGPNQRVLGFGHRFSVAWMTGDDWTGLAFDLAMHDGRGCLSPSVVLTPRADGVDRLAEALALAEATWPRGTVSAEEAARVRFRGALARVVGTDRQGGAYAVHALPGAQLDPVALPRCPMLVRVADREGAEAALQPWTRWLSTVATDDDAVTSWPGASRVTAPGQMQRPPIPRVWDGVRWPDVLWERP